MTMKSISIKQEANNFSSNVQIMDNFIELDMRIDGEKLNTILRFEEITKTMREGEDSDKSQKLIGGLSFCLSMIALMAGGQSPYLYIWWIASILILGNYFRTKKTFISIDCDRCSIVFVKNDESLQFIDKLFAIRDEYLKGEYLKINWKNDIADELNRFMWLRQIEVINDTEFKNLKIKLETT